MVSQQTQVTSDGKPSENYQDDCVAAEVCGACMWLNGVTALDHDKYNPDKFKDMAYPGEYTGGTAAVKYIQYCASLGVKLWPLDGEPGYLIQQAHAHLAMQHPVICTEPDPYMPSSYGYSHVLTFYSDEVPGHLTAHDPWINKPVLRSDADWARLLLFKQIWIAERIQQEEEVVTIDINNPEIKKHFKELNPHQWECTDTGGPWQGKVIQYALLDNYKHEGNKGLCGFDVLGRPMSNEIYINQNWVIQFFENGVRQWKDQKVSPVALYDGGPGTDPELAKLKRQLANQPQTPQALVDAIASIKAIVAKV